MTTIIQILLFSLIIIFLHELGHYLVIKILRIPIYGVGIASRPIPHFYIRYKWPKNISTHCFVILSGSLTTLIGFFVLYVFIDHPIMNLVCIAYYIQFIGETNPFFSDYVFASVIYKNKITEFRPGTEDVYRLQIKKYMFSSAWYIHFTLWCILTLFLIKHMNLQNV